MLLQYLHYYCHFYTLVAHWHVTLDTYSQPHSLHMWLWSYYNYTFAIVKLPSSQYVIYSITLYENIPLARNLLILYRTTPIRITTYPLCISIYLSIYLSISITYDSIQNIPIFTITLNIYFIPIQKDHFNISMILWWY